jgi:protein TonB
MATRALLLCGEEKAVRAVTQILDELEVSFEHSIESAFALKRLANQRFDLLIMDCDNVQSATQVFNSARASQLNKTAIAIAIVEGKAGVPNAFRLGASLVLTKPVSLEQARNTLRTGIGMTRKDAPEVKHSASMTAAAGASASVTTTQVATGGITSPTAAAASSSASVTAPTAPVATLVSAATSSATPVSPSAPPAGSTASVPTASSSTSATPATKFAATSGIAASPSSPLPLRFESQKQAGVAGTIPAPATSEKPATSEPAAKGGTAPSEPKAALAQLMATLSPLSASSSIESTAAKTSTSAAPKSDSSSASLIAELAKPKLDTVKTEELDELGDSAKLIAEDPFEEPSDTPQTLRNGAVPSFGGLSKHPFAGVDQQASRRKGILIAALAPVLAGAGIYAAWMTQPKFRDLMVWEYTNIRGRVGGNHAPPQQDVAPRPQPVAAQPAPAPVPPPAQPQQSTDQAATAPSPEPGAASAPASPVTSPTPAATSESKQAPESVPAKSPTPQNTKPGSAAAHTLGANPVLVPAAALTGAATVTTPESEILEVPEDYADDQVVHRVHPTYPHQARTKKLHGTVILQAIVNKQGRVDSLQLLSGDPILAQAAADAVKQWRYKPYSHNGEPAEFQTRVTVDFKLP